MQQPGRVFNSSSYRYGASNGQEKSTEINENSYTADFWQHDARLVRRWNIDPKPIISISPYNCFNGNPIWFSDPLGDTSIIRPDGKMQEIGDSKFETFDGSVVEVNGIKIQPIKGSLKSFTVTGDDVANGAARFVAKFKNGTFLEYAWDKKLSYSWEDFKKDAADDMIEQATYGNEPWYQHYNSPEEARKAFISLGTGVALPNVAIRPLTIATAVKKIPNITYLTKAGNYPAWNTVKTRYWNLMNKGKVPTGTAQVRMRTSGEIKEIAVSKELHHINGRGGADPHRFENLKEVWPWEHAAIDASRNTGYDFIKWVK